jgi:hypothetical protein
VLFPKPVRRQKKRPGVTAPVDPGTVAAVLSRDKGCVAAQIDPAHECRDRFGWPHAWDDLAKMTMEHVKQAPRMGVRAYVERDGRRVADVSVLIALCHAGNLNWGPTHRPEERRWLAEHA